MAGLDPAISLRDPHCQPKWDHRVTALRAGPVMTTIGPLPEDGERTCGANEAPRCPASEDDQPGNSTVSMARLRAVAARDARESGGNQAAVGVEVDRARTGAPLFALPDFGADFLAAGIGPDTGPIAAIGAVERKAGVAAGLIRHRDEVLVANAGADIACAADHPDHTVGLAGFLDRYGPGVFALAAGIGAGDGIAADRIGGESGGGAPQQGCGASSTQMSDF